MHARILPASLSLAGLILSSHAGSAAAQSLRVYQWETPRQGAAEVSLWNTHVNQSSQPYTGFDSQASREGLWTHTGELEYGMTDRFALGAYVDYQDPPGMGPQFTGTRFLARYRFFNRYQRFINPAIYLEYIVPRSSYSSAEELEARIILEKDLGDFRLVLNPLLSKAVSGDSVDEGMQLGMASGLYYRRYYAVQPGLELYSDFGPLSSLKSGSEQSQQLFPTLDLRFARNLVWNVGVGFGLTDSSDDVTVKSILTYTFDTLSPSQQQ